MLIVSHRCRDLQSSDFDFAFHTVVSLHLILQVKSRCRGHFPGLVLRGNAEAGRGPLCGWGARPAPQGTHGLEAERPLLVTLQLPIPALACGHESKPSWRPVCLRRPWAGGRVFALLLPAPELNWECLPVSSRGHGSGGACVKHAPRPTSRVLSVPTSTRKGGIFN